MRRLAMILGLGLALGASASASAFDDILASLQRAYPSSRVTGSFLDWRVPSHYRRVAGLHYGYDFSAPPGTPVATPWPATVVALTPWSEREWGVTVSAGGHRITFGHLLPTVQVGWRLQPGQCLGLVARDHVDVKVMDERDNFVDFRLLSIFSPTASPRPLAPAPAALPNDDDLERRRLIEEGVETVDDESP